MSFALGYTFFTVESMCKRKKVADFFKKKLFCIFEIGSYVAQASFELLILLPLSPKN